MIRIPLAVARNCRHLQMFLWRIKFVMWTNYLIIAMLLKGLLFPLSDNMHAATLTRRSTLLWPINSDVFFDWTFDGQSGQDFSSLEFGVMDFNTRVKFFDVNKFGTLFPVNSWPSSWIWYKTRLSWTGDVINKRITFKLINAALNDSREFYCEVLWENPNDNKQDVVKLVIIDNVQASTLTRRSTLIWPVNSDVLFDWTFGTTVNGQSMFAVEFGIMNENTKIKLFDVSSAGRLFPIDPWPSAWTWYQNRLSWTGDVANNRIVFKLTNAALNDSRRFYCEVGWKTPSDLKVDVVNLLVIVPPQIISSTFSSPLNVIEGKDVTVNCSATGKPAPSVTWTMSVNSKKFNQSVSSALLVIRDIRRDNNKDYTCTANSVGNFTATKHLKLNVVYKPEISTIVGSWDHHILTLHCVVTALPGATVLWFGPGGQQITRKIIYTTNSSILMVITSSPEDYGQYICRASNKIGNTDQTFVVSRWFTPGIPLNLRIQEKGINYTKVSWTPPANDGGTAVLDYKVKIQQNISGAVAIVLPEISGTEKLIDQLIPGTTYRVWVYARNIVGYSKPADIEFSLPNEAKGKKEQKSTTARKDFDAVYGSIIAILAILNILQLLYNVWMRRKMKAVEQEKRTSTGKDIQNKISEQDYEFSADTKELASPPLSPSNDADIPLEPIRRSWEISHDQVSLVKIIGKGAFGQVAKANVKDVPNVKRNEPVAVKMLKENAKATDRKDLLSELEVMKRLKPHRHVIKLLGCVTETDPLMVIIEYVPYGDLLGYLRKSRGLKDTYYEDPDIKPKTTLTSHQLIQFGWQIADGMEYLSSKKIIHRDLAARNVLVGEEEKCKVTDFGMARDVQKEEIYNKTSKGRLPVKWTSYESLLYGKYTTQSDVWSYGVLLYEIFTIGGCPYPGMKGHRIAQLLQDGYRMPKPQHVEQTLYQMMLDCWQENPDARPTFASLRNTLRGMEKRHVMYVNLKEYNSQLYESPEDLHGGQ